MRDIIIEDKWALAHRIAAGGWGAVYEARDINTGDDFAIKLMNKGLRVNDISALVREADAMRRLAGRTPGGKPGIPRCYYNGEAGDYDLLTTDLLGPSVSDLLNYCGGTFSLKTTLLVADQALARLQTIHQAGWLHRDVKPENFCLGTGRQGNTLYAIDMGVSITWTQATTFHETPGLLGWPYGTNIYASIDNHREQECSYKEDVEAFMYSLIEMRTGTLPWIPLADAGTTFVEIGNKKMATTVRELCRGCPPEFATTLEQVRALGFYDKPNYKKIRDDLQRIFKREGYQHDNVFDWTEKLYNETYGEPVANAGNQAQGSNPASGDGQAQGGA